MIVSSFKLLELCHCFVVEHEGTVLLLHTPLVITLSMIMADPFVFSLFIALKSAPNTAQRILLICVH
jgi:hypothetical protein